MSLQQLGRSGLDLGTSRTASPPGRAAPAATAALASLLAAVSIATLACTAFMHGYTTSRYSGLVLDARRGPGAERLELERGFDSRVDTYVGGKGEPDYIYVESETKLALVYLDRDEIAWFDRSALSSEGELNLQKPVPDAMLEFVDEEDRERFLSQRADRKSRELDIDEDASDGPTISSAIQQCYALEGPPQSPVACDVEYVEGALSMIVQFESREEAEEAWSAVAGPTIERFCAASNRANRMALVYLLSQEGELRTYSCEIGEWSEWVESYDAADGPSV